MTIIFIVVIVALVYKLIVQQKKIQQLTKKTLPAVEHHIPVISSPVVDKPIQPQVPVPDKPLIAYKDSTNLNISQVSATQWFTVIGVLAILFGLGFLFKYSIDHGWLSEVGRILIGLFVGALMITLGEVLKNKLVKYSNAIVGGGLAVLYVTVSAGYNLYGIYNSGITLIMLLLVTIIGVVLSHRHKSPTLIILSMIGAYLAPLFIDLQVTLVALGVYLTLLTISSLVMATKMFRISFFYIMVIGMSLVFGEYLLRFNISSYDLFNAIFVISFVIFNLATIIVWSSALFRQSTDYTKRTIVAMLLWKLYLGGWALYLVSLFAKGVLPAFEPLGYLIIAIIYFISYGLLLKLADKLMSFLLFSMGLIIVISACVKQFNGDILYLSLLLVAVLVIFAGFKYKRIEMRSLGLVLSLITGILIIGSDYHQATYKFLFNIKFGLEILWVIIMSIIGWGYLKYKEILDEGESVAPSLISGITVVTVWAVVSWELMVYFAGDWQTDMRNLSLSIWWMLYAVILGIVSGVLRNAVVRKMSIILFIVTICKVFLYDVLTLETIYRIISFISLGVILLTISYFYQKYKEKIYNFIKLDS